MLKMLMDPVGGIVLTNDGHAILREIDIKHPSGKTIGDGTTSVVCLTGELLS